MPVPCTITKTTEALLDAALAAKDLLPWRSVLVSLLDRYAGLEEFLDDPYLGHPVTELVRFIRALPFRPDDEDLAAALCGLDFMTWRIECDHARWNPLLMSLSEFLTQCPQDAELDAWQWSDTWPVQSAIKDWLLNTHRQVL